MSVAAEVWIVDDGEKVKEDAASVPDALEKPLRLFGYQAETVAFQVVVHAGDAPATATVEVEGFRTERFVEHFVDVRRASGGKYPRESLGWAAGSGPTGSFTGRVPDALIPVEHAPPWRPYPLAVAPRRNGIVWVDVELPRAAGVHRGTVVVNAERIPLEIEVAARALPERPVATMLFDDAENLKRRLGTDVEAELWKLLRRHRLTPLHVASTPEDVDRQRAALDGSLYGGKGDGVLAIGAYGDLGEPTPEKLETVLAIGDRLGPLLETTDTFVYAVDEDCESPYGPAWKALLAATRHAKRIRVAWTCSKDPGAQGVDIPIQLGTYDVAKAKAARAQGKEVWIYNGQQPHTGTFLLDAPAIAPRVNGWIQGVHDIPRWFYWEVGFWYDGNRGGHGPYDPFVTAETFHDADGDWANGDGVLVYPGRQVDRFTEHSLGWDGVLPSIRLKNWRRGVQDAGYVQYARIVDRAAADAIARRVLPAVLAEAKEGRPATWSEEGRPFREGRRALFDLAERKTEPPPPKRSGCGHGCGTALFGLFVLRWRRKRQV